MRPVLFCCWGVVTSMTLIRKDLLIVLTLVAILTLMIVPLSQAIIDVLLAANLSLAVVLMVVAIYLKSPSDFSTFPTVILIGTALRLALSIGTTRLILTEADAGQIIETFGDFVIAGSVAVGLVIFLIITVVQFLVITKGAERVAEVGARFALDALPGKQMSIDADIRAGSLSAEEGSVLRKKLDRDSQFFGAMDGAMKFVKGDAIAGLIIIVINLVGGLIIGTTIMGFGLAESMAVFSLLTIGDGLVAQIPALMMSLCAGIIVTRVTHGENKDLGSDIFQELLSDIRVPSVSAAIVLLMGFIPGFPTLVFAIAAGLLLLSWFFSRRLAALAEREAAETEDAADAANLDAANGTIDNSVTSDRFSVLIGSGLAAVINLDGLRQSIENSFSQLAYARGIAFPPPQIVVNNAVGLQDIVLELDEVPIYQDTIPADALLVEAGLECLPLIGCNNDSAKQVNWLDTVGVWIPNEYRAALQDLNLDISQVEVAMAKLAFRVYEQNLGLLFSKTEYKAFMAAINEIDPESVELVKTALPGSALMQTLRYLVEDGVPLRPARLVLDALVHWTQANPGAGAVLISECLRGSLKRQLCHLISGPENVLGVAMIDPELEALARKSVADAKRTGNLASVDGLMFDTEHVDAIVNAFRSLTTIEEHRRKQLAIVTSTDIRRRLRNFLAANNIHVPVLAAHEISSDVMTCPIQLVRMPKEIHKLPEMA